MVGDAKQIVCCLVVGHSTSAEGAVSPSGVSELEFNGPLAKEIAKRVEGVEVEVVYRNPGDEGYATLPTKINLLRPDFIICLHANSSNPCATGSEVLHWPGSAGGERLATLLLGEIREALRLPVRGVKPRGDGRGAYVLRKTVAPCVISEPFFICNSADFQIATDRKDLLTQAYKRTIEQYAALVRAKKYPQKAEPVPIHWPSTSTISVPKYAPTMRFIPPEPPVPRAGDPPHWRRALRFALERLKEPSSWGALGILSALGLGATGAGLIAAALPLAAGLIAQVALPERAKHKKYATHIPVRIDSGTISTSTITNPTNRGKIMAESKGITETKEAISGAVAVVNAAREAGADGYQVSDAGVLITDTALQSAILQAAEGAQQIPGELGDLSLAEGLDLSQHTIEQLRTLA